MVRVQAHFRSSADKPVFGTSRSRPNFYEAERAPLTLTPAAATTTAVLAVGPLVSERWADDPSMEEPPVTDPGAPMGLNMEPSDQPTLEARPGPGAEVPKLLTLIGVAWLGWLVWSTSGRLAQRLPSVTTLRGLLVATLGISRRALTALISATTR